MFEGWEDYSLLIGSAAAALIGLLFVVMTLTAGRERSAIEHGARLYMTPVVFAFGTILVLSGAAMAPAVGATLVGPLALAIGAIGAVGGVQIAFGIHRLPPDATGASTMFGGTGSFRAPYPCCWRPLAPGFFCANRGPASRSRRC